MPRTGLSARTMLMSASMFITPMAPKNKNQSVMTGPKALPMVEVPAFCKAKRVQRMMMVIMTTMC